MAPERYVCFQEVLDCDDGDEVEYLKSESAQWAANSWWCRGGHQRGPQQNEQQASNSWAVPGWVQDELAAKDDARRPQDLQDVRSRVSRDAQPCCVDHLPGRRSCSINNLAHSLKATNL